MNADGYFVVVAHPDCAVDLTRMRAKATWAAAYHAWRGAVKRGCWLTYLGESFATLSPRAILDWYGPLGAQERGEIGRVRNITFRVGGRA